MIIPLETQDYRLEAFIVCPRVPATVDELRERMLQRAKVTQGSYAYQLIEDLHSAIFLQALDLKADYEAYFAREYATFSEYIRRRTRIPSAAIDQVVAAVDTSSGVYYVKRSFDYLSDTHGLGLLSNLLEELPSGVKS